MIVFKREEERREREREQKEGGMEGEQGGMARRCYCVTAAFTCAGSLHLGIWLLPPYTRDSRVSEDSFGSQTVEQHQ